MRTIAPVVALGLTSILASFPAAAQTAPPIPQAAPAEPLPILPDGPPPVPAAQHRDLGLMRSGMITVGIAGATTLGGILLVAIPGPRCVSLCFDGLGLKIGGLAMIGLGLLLGGGGAAMWAYGAPAPDGAKPKASWLRPSVTLGPGTAAATWSF